jgi:MFS family permease
LITWPLYSHASQIVLFVGLGSITYGYGSSIIATTTGQPTFLEYFELDTRSNAADLLGAINGLFSAGGLFGCISCFWIPDKFGRKKAILIASFISIIGNGLAAGSVHIAMFIIARLITGFSVGALVSLVPLYQSEISPPKIRGLLVGMHGTGIATGYVAASWIGFGFYFVNASGTQWRMPLAIGAFWPLALAIGVLFIPESPRWREFLLQSKGQTSPADSTQSLSTIVLTTPSRPSRPAAPSLDLETTSMLLSRNSTCCTLR